MSDDKPDFTSPIKAMTTMLALKPKPGAQGEFPCPKCGGKFHWRYGGPRAFRGWCETPGCIRFLS